MPDRAPNDFDPVRDLQVELDDRKLARKVTCLPCGEVVFNLEPIPRPTENDRLREGKGLAAHLELSHGLVAFYGRCEDSACGRFHLSAFEADQVPPEFRRLRNQG